MWADLYRIQRSACSVRNQKNSFTVPLRGVVVRQFTGPAGVIPVCQHHRGNPCVIFTRRRGDIPELRARHRMVFMQVRRAYMSEGAE